MYSLTFSRETIKDLLAYAHGVDGWGYPKGRQFYGAVLMPDSGYFTSKLHGEAPKIVCPYQVNDIIAIQEQWARSATGYVYKIQPDSMNPTGHETDPAYNKPDLTGYDFRPASTMPVEAARLFGRITSITPWPLTQDIAKYYLSPWAIDKYNNVAGNSPGTTDFLSPGVGKTIDYYDKGNKLLSTMRKVRNKQVLQKSGQPIIPGWDSLPISTSYRYYYMNKPTSYWTIDFYLNTEETLIAQSHQVVPRTLSVLTTNVNCLGTSSTPLTPGGKENPTINGVVVNTDTLINGDWVWYSSGSWTKFAWINNQWRAFKTYDIHQGWTYVESSDNRYEDDSNYYKVRDYEDSYGIHHLYLVLSGSRPIPVYATYPYEIIDPQKNIYVWLISGYLCNKDEKGNWVITHSDNKPSPF